MTAHIEIPRYTGFDSARLRTDKHRDIVFVYGALRSGTTVFRLMLDAHHRINNPGEMDFLFDHLHVDETHPTGWQYDLETLRLDRIFRSFDLSIEDGLTGLDLLDSFLDQIKARAPWQVLSINLHRNIDRVWQILPHVRVLHILRDPRDVARSSIQMGWAGTHYHGVGHWVATETCWDQALEANLNAQTQEVTYEALVQKPEKTLRQVCLFFDVPFDPNMVTYYQHTSYGPPDASLAEQWRHTCSDQDLQEVESRASALMMSRGYQPVHPPLPINTPAKLNLALRNKVHIWQFGMSRFGALVFWAEKLTRWAGLKAAHRHYKLRMDAISVQYLK